MNHTVRLEIPVLLPGVKDHQDACIARLVSLLEARDGIADVHVTHGIDGGTEAEHAIGQRAQGEPDTPGALCIHHDPERISLEQITDLAMRAGAALVQRYGHALIPFRGVGAEDEGTRIESALLELPGVTAASVNLPEQIARVEFDSTRIGVPAILDRMQSIGATPETTGLPSLPIPHVEPAGWARRAHAWYRRNRELVWSLVAGAFTLAGWLVSRASRSGGIVLYAGAYVFGGRDNIEHAVRDIRRGHFRFNIDLLMVVAALGAALLGAWAEGALLLFLFSLGHALQHYALGRARDAIKALGELTPHTARVRRGRTDVILPIQDVRPGDLVVVRPGERLAVDGVVRDGASVVNQAPITGESVPVEKSPGAQVFAGSVNGDGGITIRVSAAVGDRTMDRMISLVAEAGTRKAPTQQFTERFERIFVPGVLVVDLIVMIAPPLIGFWTWPEAFYRAMALLVAASPCALALGTPAAVLAGIAQAARNGVLIKGGAYLEALGQVETLALDKTGTITRGEPVVTDVVPMSIASAEILLSIAAAVERESRHPVARAIVRAADEQALQTHEVTDVEALTGRGIRARVDGILVEVGRLSLFDAAIPRPTQELREAVARLESEGKTTVVVRVGNQRDEWAGLLAVADEPRSGVRDVLAELHARHVGRIVMLTGDNPDVAMAMGESMGIDDVRAGLLPEDKLTAIRELTAQAPTAMVGDGVNDAPALAHATVGIAMGGAGSAAALETADVALMSDDLSRLPFAIGLSRRARAIIRQNVVVSLCVITVLAVATVVGWASIGPAVIVHEGSTLVVVANALRLLRYQ